MILEFSLAVFCTLATELISCSINILFFLMKVDVSFSKFCCLGVAATFSFSSFSHLIPSLYPLHPFLCPLFFSQYPPFPSPHPLLPSLSLSLSSHSLSIPSCSLWTPSLFLYTPSLLLLFHFSLTSLSPIYRMNTFCCKELCGSHLKFRCQMKML